MKRRDQLFGMTLMMLALGMGAWAGWPQTALTTEDQERLQFALEEEKMARDVYTVLATKWGERPFGNIAQAEKQHMRLVSDLMVRRGMAVPAEEKPGKFRNPEIQKLYRDFEKRGLSSRLEALRVGATVEDRDLFDLDKNLAATRDPEVKTVFTALRAGSANHIRAFTRNLSRQGVTYEPQFISPETLKAILSGRG